MSEIIDKELLQEGINEINDLIDHTEELLLDAEKNGISALKNSYDHIFRNLHSIKGNCSMLGLNKFVKPIHDLESFFKHTIDSYEFPYGIIDITLEFLNNLRNELKSPLSDSLMKNFNRCFDCVKENNYLKVCKFHKKNQPCGPSPDKTTRKEQIIHEHLVNDQLYEYCSFFILGHEPEIEKQIQNKNKIYKNFHCPNEIYTEIKRYKNIKAVFLSSTYQEVNVFYIAKVLNYYSQNLKLYIIVNKQSSILTQIDLSSINCEIVGVNSKKYFKIIEDFHFDKLK